MNFPEGPLFNMQGSICAYQAPFPNDYGIVPLKEPFVQDKCLEIVNLYPPIAVKFKKLRTDAIIPMYMTLSSSGMDLCAAIDKPVQLWHNSKLVVSTGLSVEIPVGSEGQVRPRSGLAAKHAITVINSPGTIDSDYRGEIKVILYKMVCDHCEPFYLINPGDRIAQLVICPVNKFKIEEVKDLSITQRADGGLGSTGK
jgi:dUTP pyrophosphatase